MAKKIKKINSNKKKEMVQGKEGSDCVH